jgi:hypothetical protein
MCHWLLNMVPLFYINIINPGIALVVGESKVLYVLVLVHICCEFTDNRVYGTNNICTLHIYI